MLPWVHCGFRGARENRRMKTFLLALMCGASLAFAGPITNGNFDGNLGNPSSINPWTANRWNPIALTACSLASSTTVNCTSTTGVAAGMVISGAGLATSPANSTLVVTTPITSTSFTVTGGTITVCPSALTASYLYPIPSLAVTRVANSITANPNATPYSLRVDGRGAAADGPKQSIGAGLANGARYTTRFYIKLDAPAQVRCLVQLSGVGSVPPILLAETVVRAPQVGQWVAVQGTNTVSWSGTLAGAQIYFAVEQLYPLGAAAPAGAFPGYNLNDVQMEVDTDGDGKFDSEETATFHTNPLLADTDGDGIPDGWEIAHG